MKPSWLTRLSFDKFLLALVILLIWACVLLLEKWMPRQSAPIFVLSLFILYVFLISLANLHRRRQLAKGRSTLVPGAENYHPTVSIVVPAHNEEFVIEDTVRCLMALDYDQYDLWVFDDRSTDGTAAVLARLATQYPPEKFHYVVRPPEATPGKSAVLNDALACTRGEVIAVFDADGRVAPDFLKRILPYLAEEGVGAVQARKVIQNAQANLLTRCQFHEYLMDAHFQTGRDTIRGAVELRGNGQLAKRIALESVEGWTEDTITDDLDLSTKLHLAGWDLRFAADASVQEEGILYFKPLLRQRRRWAEGSLKRYLEYSPQMLVSPDISKRVMADMWGYFLKFMFPLWVCADLSVQTLNALFGEPPGHWLTSLVVFPALAVFFVAGAFVAIRHFQKAGIWHSLVWAIETAVFLLVVWVPVVMWITAKILVARDRGPLNWGKTQHLGTQAMVKPARLTRIKNFFQRQSQS